ncbi:MAG: hypothetical protein M3375_08600 [Actinomycetota bacterium]|nr:hypothetical protein [Actinomycetota bacterium]
MEFGTVLIVICVVGTVVAVLSFWGSGSIYEGLGRSGGLWLDEPDTRPRPRSAGAEAQEDLRQLLEAKSARRERRGEAPLDIEAEMAALSQPAPAPRDAAVRDEVRQLVLARNERRARQGKAPLDVEAEVERQLSQPGG